jgi:hypothetical protein
VPGPAGSAGLAIDPLQVALLKWAPYSGVSLPVGAKPTGVAFDGANIWVANENSSNVIKLRARDGADLGTFNAGTGPDGVAFDNSGQQHCDQAAEHVAQIAQYACLLAHTDAKETARALREFRTSWA